MWTSATVGIILAVVAAIAGVVAVFVALPAFRRERALKSEDRFQTERLALVRNRAELVGLAELDYESRLHIGGTPCLTAPEWTLPAPVLLDDVIIHYSPSRRETRTSGDSIGSASLIPPSLVRKGIRTYSGAIGHFPSLRPTLFWDGLSYDLRDFEVAQEGTVHLELGLASFFEMLDVCESLAHEFSIHRAGIPTSLRESIGDPFDLSRRVSVPALTWLLLINEPDGRTSFALHARDEKAVASDGAFKHVFGGQLQPSSEHVMDAAGEASLWKCFAREFCEELLGMGEADGHSGAPVDYGAAPLSTLRRLADDGDLRVSLLGLGIDPLSLWPSLLAVAVGERERLASELPSFVEKNSEGVVVTEGRQRGFEFNQHNVDQFCDDSRVGVAAKGCLRLAWAHRAALGVTR